MLKVPAVLGCSSRTFPSAAMAGDVSDVATAACSPSRGKGYGARSSHAGGAMAESWLFADGRWQRRFAQVSEENTQRASRSQDFFTSDEEEAICAEFLSKVAWPAGVGLGFAECEPYIAKEPSCVQMSSDISGSELCSLEQFIRLVAAGKGAGDAGAVCLVTRPPAQPVQRAVPTRRMRRQQRAALKKGLVLQAEESVVVAAVPGAVAVAAADSSALPSAAPCDTAPLVGAARQRVAAVVAGALTKPRDDRWVHKGNRFAALAAESWPPGLGVQLQGAVGLHAPCAPASNRRARRAAAAAATVHGAGVCIGLLDEADVPLEQSMGEVLAGAAAAVPQLSTSAWTPGQLQQFLSAASLLCHCDDALFRSAMARAGH